jgi:pyridoxal phosphate enzyme (YggS family)
MVVQELRKRLDEIRSRIDRACMLSGRDPSGVTLIAVSKTQPIEAIRSAYDLGLRHFGESRLQEALPKIETLPGDITWHYIGHLQSNKAKKIAGAFDSVHTFCNEGQIREASKAERLIDGLVEVNIAKEDQKSGLLLQNVDGFAEMLLQLPWVKFRGLMTIGPALEDAEAMRPYFREVREANLRLGGDWLSMGMSHDFEVAIQEGSTHIRVGTALFGAR